MRFFSVLRVPAVWRPMLMAMAVELVGSSGVAAQTSWDASAQIPVTIHPGENIQDAVNRYPEGTSFLLKSGVHTRQKVRPRNGNSFIGEPGTILDGENAQSQAFVSRASNVTIRGLRITRYVPPGSGSTVEGHGTSGWVVENNEIDHNVNGSERVSGVRPGSNWILRGNKIHHNGWNGINGYEAFDTLIEGNEIYANPPAAFADHVGEAGNIKLFQCGRIIIRNNYIHDSPFKGIWLDTSLPDMTVEGNRVVNHGHAGIWYEVSYRGVIRGNYVDNAGYASKYNPAWLTGGGIEVTNSPDVTITHNTVVNSYNGIIGVQAAGYHNGDHGVNETRNLLVRGNRIVMPKGQTGMTQNVGSNSIYVQWNNRFVDNAYELGTNATPFRWMGLNLDEHQWKAYMKNAESYSRGPMAAGTCSTVDGIYACIAYDEQSSSKEADGSEAGARTVRSGVAVPAQ